MPDWLTISLLLAGGGSAGTLARYWLGTIVREVQRVHWPEMEFPWATFFINVSGSLFLGFLTALFLNHPDDPVRRNWYLLLGTGFCGGFTTFSTFSLETFILLRDGELGPALAYVLGSVAAGILGVWFAMRIMKPPVA